MTLKNAKAVLSVALCACLLSGCGNSITSPSGTTANPAETPADTAAPAGVEQSPFPGTETEGAETAPLAPSGAAGQAGSPTEEDNTPECFWAMADHSQYLVGVVTSCHFEDYPQESCIYFEADGQEFCVRGSLGREHEGLLPFHSIYSYSGKESDECRPGWHIAVYFEDDLSAGETTITQPKDIFLAFPEDSEAPREWLKITEYEYAVLQKNYDALAEKSVFSPSEALRRVGGYLGLEDAQLQSVSPGVYVYTDGQHTVSFLSLHYNAYYQLDREAAAEAFSVVEPDQAARYLDEAFPGDGITSQPFIEYKVMDQQGESIDFYYVSINGEISTWQTVYDIGQGTLAKM